MMKQLIFKLKDIVNRLFLLVVKFFIYMCVSTMKYNGLLYYASVTGITSVHIVKNVIQLESQVIKHQVRLTLH